MKIKLIEAMQAFMVLQKIGQEKMPITPAWILQRNLRLLQPDCEAYERQRTELIKTQYGAQDENKNWTVVPEKLEAFQGVMKELGEAEITLDLKTVHINQLAGINIAPNDLFALSFMFDDGTPEAGPLPPKPSRKRH